MGKRHYPSAMMKSEFQTKDPGASGTISINKTPCFVNLVSAAAETRTLARPTRVGLRVLLHMRTDGGDITLTVTGGYNEAGSTTFTFFDVGQWIEFISCESAGTFYWRKVADYTTGNLTADSSGNITVNDDAMLSFGGVANIGWVTDDANANKLVCQFPTGGVVDVPVLVFGQGAGVVGDMAIHDGITEPTQCWIGVGAVATGPRFEFRKARGTAAAPTVVTSADDLGQIDAYACVAAAEWVRSAQILFECTGTIATTRGPGVITFKTATDAAPSVLTTALTISAAQVVTCASTAVVQGASITVGVAGTTTGNLLLAGATSGTVGLRATAAAGDVVFILPAAVGTNGQQLATDGNAGTATLSWTAAASMREMKQILGLAQAEDALARVTDREIYEFRYREDAPMSTRDFDTLYRGPIAEEYPEVMHYNGTILNPINAFGELALAVKAIAARLDKIEMRLA